MIRHFESVDVRRINSNEFSGTKDIQFVFDDPEFYKFTFVSGEADVVAIICFKRYWKNNFVGFLLIAKNMPTIFAREIRCFLHNVLIDFQMERMQTDSVSTDGLRKWHEFLGFTYEGHRPKMIYDKDYDQWGIVKGRDF